MENGKEMIKKYSGKAIIVILAMIIGLVITVQIRLTNGQYSGGLVPLVKLQEIVAELNQVKQEKDIAMAELLAVEESLKQLQNEKASEDQYINTIVSDLEKYKMLAGLTDVKGPGIVITIEDPPPGPENFMESSVIMYNYEQLLNLVNKLKDGGAEAISINGQRIIASTEISLAGENVNINAKATAPPYEIKAIGNADTLESTISIRFGIVEKLRTTYGLKVTIEKKDEVMIPRYNKVIQFRHAAPVTESEGPGA